MKVRKREELGLPPLPEDSIQVMRSMRAASPPTYCIELVEQQQQKRGHRSRRVRASASSRDVDQGFLMGRGFLLLREPACAREHVFLRPPSAHAFLSL